MDFFLNCVVMAVTLLHCCPTLEARDKFCYLDARCVAQASTMYKREL